MKTIDSFDSLQEHALMGITQRKFETVAFGARMNQPGRSREEFGANGLQDGRIPRFRQTNLLEPIDQVVSQEDEMKMNLIGQEAVGGNTAQRESLFELSNVEFAASSWFVKVPDILRGQIQIGNKNMIEVFLVFPESQLFLRLLNFGFGPTQHAEAMRLVPILRLITELSDLPSFLPEGVISQRPDFELNRSGHLGDDGVSNPLLVEWFDEFVVVESRVAADTNSIEVFGNPVLTTHKKTLSAADWMSISGSQDAMPAIPASAFETNQWMITRTSGLFGIVSDFGFFDLPAEHRQNGGIEIEDQAAGISSELPNSLAQRVVNAYQPIELLRADALEEFSQGGRAGKAFEPQQTLKVTVVSQNARVGEPLHASDHRVDHGQYQFCWMIAQAAAIPANLPLQQPFDIEFSTKLLEQEHPAVMRQGGIVEGDFDISDTFAHATDSSLLVTFARQHLYAADYT